MPVSHDETMRIIARGSAVVLGTAGMLLFDYLALQKAQLLKGISVPVESIGDRELWALGNRIEQEKRWRMKYGISVGQQQPTPSPASKKRMELLTSTRLGIIPPDDDINSRSPRRAHLDR
ncbi:hypothetical protein CLAIMM_08524 [Cladophialophora immunda]|nr:hypothetical protein CLAIMM_08524 [Cladophialophora immunda]